MNEKEIEEEIEKRVEKKIATRDFLLKISEVVMDFSKEGCLNTKDFIEILTGFVIQGYIFVYGCDEKGESSFKDAINKGWDDYKKKYQQENGEDEIDDDDLVSLKAIIKELHEKLI